ncbi:MAG: hypothetical protein PHN84_09520 [Desulfuromonadaceae bacterium]|nr:hypothetical protein [Desulfuromonadaceae bacterium]MDD2856772.1 hypothetical protein [Desulfuromonadaceae bacterium]
MKTLLTWGAVSFLTGALLDPVIYSMLEQPIPWGRDALMLAAGIGCFYLLIKFRDSF